jgi:23S rRNA pseudouridine2605 synthase
VPATKNKDGGHGLARTLSKLGYCSRSQAEKLVATGVVTVNGLIRRDPEFRTFANIDKITVGGQPVVADDKLYVVFNKPRGLVTTRNDEIGRDTIYSVIADPKVRKLSAVGRLDKASEGLLLLTNDSSWANAITDPDSHVDKTYHVQINAILSPDQIQKVTAGVVDENGERLAAASVIELRRGEKNSWLEIVLDEGKNRQIRRLLAAFEVEVLRLLRVGVGSLQLGTLSKGQWRYLSANEVRELSTKAS